MLTLAASNFETLKVRRKHFTFVVCQITMNTTLVHSNCIVADIFSTMHNFSQAVVCRRSAPKISIVEQHDRTYRNPTNEPYAGIFIHFSFIFIAGIAIHLIKRRLARV